MTYISLLDPPLPHLHPLTIGAYIYKLPFRGTFLPFNFFMLVASSYQKNLLQGEGSDSLKTALETVLSWLIILDRKLKS